MITGKMKITDVVKAYPKAIEIFNDFHIDYCCGGNDALEDAVKELGIESNSFIELLNKKLANQAHKSNKEQVLAMERLMEMSIPDLIDYIIDTHHLKERGLLAEIDELINKVFLVHYEHHQEQLIPLHSLFSDLRKELQQHFVKEEKLIFPYMQKNFNGDKGINYVKSLEYEHEAAGNLIKEITACTNDFTAPEDGCTSYRVLFQKLQELVKDVYIHIFIENSLLFQKYEGEI
ncbi:iron-sulfur cluster repair di-iron protein [Proteiniclasticum ruminis]|uniref:iron-sulfur cluster repair di-iron protein n=1 Tax=Proteiniclasticum ruminis TaxID=398199 RepID=UPI0028B0B2BF|nr:iron-sulfur cluster repair di-iron protein [Proteiniclasticum ruminis]